MVDETRRTLLASIGTGASLALASTAASAETADCVPGDVELGDPDAAIDESVRDLVDDLETGEKIRLLHQYQEPVPRLDLPAFRTGTEALHGVAWLGEATVFPQAIGLGSTWDPELIERVGSAVGDEVRGKHAETNGGVGLNVWSPTVDPLRDPRWGRNEEGYAEDPLLSGDAASAYTSGLAGDDPEYLKTAPVLKHFVGYNNEANRTTTNAEIPPRLLHDYYLPFFRPPIAAGDAVGVMASYNVLNGRPMTVSPLLDEIRAWAPEDSPVMNVSDAWAPMNLTGAQEYFDAVPEARAAAVHAGLDSFTEWGSDNSTTVEGLADALDQGLLDEDELDAAVGHVLSVRSRLGDFDDQSPYADIGDEVIGSPDHREAAREAAREQAVLLKHDDDDAVLPLSGDEDVAVVGPLADRSFTDWYSGDPPYRTTIEDGVRDRIGADAVETATGMDRIRLRETESGDYVTAGVSKGGGGLSLGGVDAPSVQEFTAEEWEDDTYTLLAAGNNRYVTVEGGSLQNSVEFPYGWDRVPEAFEFVDAGDGAVALRHLSSAANGEAPFVGIEDGSLTVSAEDESAAATFELEVREDGIEAAAAAAADADVAVVAVGNHPMIGGRETHDREDLSLTASHRELVERVYEANEDTVLVLKSSFPYAITWADEHVPSILWTSHAGQEEGRGLADLIYGDAPPGGRVPQTWPRSADQLPDITEYNIAEAETTYRYGQSDPLYAFGHGESYADFAYDRARIRPGRKLHPGDSTTISVRVTNEGSATADEVVQVYTGQRRSRTRQPERVLRGYERVRLDPGESATVEVDVAFEDFAVWDVERNGSVVEQSSHDVWIGSASDDIREKEVLHLRGEQLGPRDLTEATRAVDADDWTWESIELLDRSREAGTVVGMADGSWVSFADVDLREKPTEALLSVARAESGDATLELRSGSPSGKLLGTATAPSTGDVYSYEDVAADLENASGNQRDLYLVARGAVRVDTIRLG